MTKVKFLILFFSFVILMLGIPTVVNATTVEYTRTIPSNDGTIVINFTGVELDPTKAYEFALVRQGNTPETWFSIDDGYTQNSATVTLSSTVSAIVDVLKVTDTGFIYIREKDDTTGSYILEAQLVNLCLPYLQSISYTKEDGMYNLLGMLYGSIGNNFVYTGGNQTFVAWEKVTDEDFVEEFLDIKNNQGELTDLETSLDTPPSANYFSASRQPSYSDKNDGLYLLWVKRTGTKSVISCIIHDGLPEATTVSQYVSGTETPKMTGLEISSSSSLTYEDSTGYILASPGITITIKATFNKTIYGNTAPALTIKCGNGEENELSGTITGQYIFYNYTITEEDKGIISAIKMSGGDVADIYGNKIEEYSCPTLYTHWGAFGEERVVYANGSGIVTNPEDNSDSNNGTNKEETGTNNSENSDTNNETTKDDSTIKKEDTTTSPTVLPNTGLEIGIVLLLAILMISTVAYLKYNKLKGI